MKGYIGALSEQPPPKKHVRRALIRKIADEKRREGYAVSVSNFQWTDGVHCIDPQLCRRTRRGGSPRSREGEREKVQRSDCAAENDK